MSVCYSDIMHHFHHSYASNTVNLYFKHLLYICYLMKKPGRTALSTTCGTYVQHTLLPQLICGLVRNRFLPQHLQRCRNGLVTSLATRFLAQNTRSSYWNNRYFSDTICWKRAWKNLHKKKQLLVFQSAPQSCSLLPHFSHVTRPTVAIRTWVLV